MKRDLLMAGLCAILVGGLALVSTAAPQPGENLVPDTQFKKFDYDTEKHFGQWKQRWIPHEIEAPYGWELNAEANSVELVGGKTFLHSPHFAVTPDNKLSVAVTAEGDGTVSVQCLFWTEDDGMADPHVTTAIEPTDLDGERERVAGTTDVPDNAAQVYLRIIAEDGTVTVTEPSAMLVE